MPYYVLSADCPTPEPSYQDIYFKRIVPLVVDISTRAEAHECAKSLGGIVYFVASTDELDSWRERERNRFDDGTYVSVPWTAPHRLTQHYAHLSVKSPGLIAYTADIERGIQDRQTSIKPGRYLQQFYADIFSRDEMAHYVSLCAADQQTIKLARSLADVRAVYRNGPTSCMGGSADHTSQYWREEHLGGHRPIDVYAEPSDLAVAYFGTLDCPSQRCIVWPERKIYSRIYGTGPLKHLLEHDGYKPSYGTDDDDAPTLEGARLNTIRFRDGFILPYLDGVLGAYFDGSAIRIGKNARFTPLSIDETQGCVGASPDNQDDEDEDEVRYRCAHCRDYFNESESESTDYCQSCYDDQWSCDDCGGISFSNDDCNSLSNRTVCGGCYRALETECDTRDCANRWIESEEFTRAEIRERTSMETSIYCRDCARAYVRCDECDTTYNSEDDETCPSCAEPPAERDNQTTDLPFDTAATGKDGPYHLIRTGTTPSDTSHRLSDRCYGSDGRTPAIGDRPDDPQLLIVRAELSSLYPEYQYIIVSRAEAERILANG